MAIVDRATFSSFQNAAGLTDMTDALEFYLPAFRSIKTNDAGNLNTLEITEEFYSNAADSFSTGFTTYPTIAYNKDILVYSKDFGGTTYYFRLETAIRRLDINYDSANCYFICECLVQMGTGHAAGVLSNASNIYKLVLDYGYFADDTDPLAANVTVSTDVFADDGGITAFLTEYDGYLMFGVVVGDTIVDQIAFHLIEDHYSDYFGVAIQHGRDYSDVTLYNNEISDSAAQDLSLSVDALDTAHTRLDAILVPTPVTGTDYVFKAYDVTLDHTSHPNPTVDYVYPAYFVRGDTYKPRKFSQGYRYFEPATSYNATAGFIQAIGLVGSPTLGRLIYCPFIAAYTTRLPSYTVSPIAASQEEEHNEVLRMQFPLDDGIYDATFSAERHSLYDGSF